MKCLMQSIMPLPFSRKMEAGLSQFELASYLASHLLPPPSLHTAKGPWNQMRITMTSLRSTETDRKLLEKEMIFLSRSQQVLLKLMMMDSPLSYWSHLTSEVNQELARARPILWMMKGPPGLQSNSNTSMPTSQGAWATDWPRNSSLKKTIKTSSSNSSVTRCSTRKTERSMKRWTKSWTKDKIWKNSRKS